MQHRRKRALGVLVFENCERVGVGVAGVNFERQSGFARRGDVIAKAFGLRGGRRVLVEIVEPRFADGHDLRVLATAARSRLTGISSSSCA